MIVGYYKSLSAGFAEKSGPEVRPYSLILVDMVFIVWYSRVLFYFSPLGWNQHSNFCPECCCKSKNYRPCSSKDQDRGSVLSNRNKWKTHPSCKPSLPWYSSAHFLVVPRVLFCPYKALARVIGKGNLKKMVCGRKEDLHVRYGERLWVEGEEDELWSQ